MGTGHIIKAREVVARRVIAKYESNMSNYYDLGRTLYTRCKQHYADYIKAARLHKNRGGNAEHTSSWMRDHTLVDHAGEVGSDPHQDYHFHLVSNHRESMTHQITEALRIEISLEYGT